MLYHAASESVRSHLAANLRRLRVAQRISLSELARSTATSKATLSGIERGRANPTVDTLTALAGALNVQVADLLLPLPLGEVRVVRVERSGQTGSEQVPLHPIDTIELDGKAELLKLTLQARQIREERPQPAGSRAHALVLHGKLITGPVDRITELAPGDYASFPADVPYIYETTRTPASALVLVNTPQ